VAPKETLLRPAEELLAIMRWIGATKPATDRWRPVFGRYLDQLADRVRGFGGDPASSPPSSSGALPPPPAGHNDRFGDFHAFILATEHGDALTVRSREAAVERIVDRAWRERIRVRLTLTDDEHRHLLAIALHGPPSQRT
jgi:hypothetical protein